MVWYLLGDRLAQEVLLQHQSAHTTPGHLFKCKFWVSLCLLRPGYFWGAPLRLWWMTFNLGSLRIGLWGCISVSGYHTGVRDTTDIITGDVKVLSVRFFHCEVTIFPFVIYKYLGRATLGLCKYHRLEKTSGDMSIKCRVGSWIKSWNRKRVLMENLWNSVRL